MTNIANITRTIEPPVRPPESAEQSGLRHLEVNVIFTGTKATALALKTASRLAADLNARIRILAAFAVPVRLPLDHPQVSVAFMEKLLGDLVSQLPDEAPEATGHIYLCRERMETFSRVLLPNSLVVLAGPKRPWRTDESRIAQRLQSGGHRVIFVPLGSRN
ncbi:MAG TPA: hypothetical protein VG322_14130 [Candidatus Acidoferrales bacterium]|jgi:hypothetical protein|nr:hypothetical protein [Candidatus Acidoferrales bacterium]